MLIYQHLFQYRQNKNKNKIENVVLAIMSSSHNVVVAKMSLEISHCEFRKLEVTGSTRLSEQRTLHL